MYQELLISRMKIKLDFRTIDSDNCIDLSICMCVYMSDFIILYMTNNRIYMH